MIVRETHIDTTNIRIEVLENGYGFYFFGLESNKVCWRVFFLDG